MSSSSIQQFVVCHVGPLAIWLVGAMEGAVVVGGLGALAAALYSIGIPHNSSVQYETALKSDKFLVIAHGTADEVANAKSILETAGASHIDVHSGLHNKLEQVVPRFSLN